MRIIAFCGAALLVACCQAGAVTSFFDTFNGQYVNGPIGPIPSGWNFFGYGPPAWTQQEAGIVLPPNDGTNSSTRWNVPGNLGSQDSGTIAIYKTGVSLDNLAIPGQPIDWSYPVYLKADVYGVDYGYLTMFKTTLDMQGYTRTTAQLEWGDNGNPNGQWATLSTVIAPGQAGKSGNLVLVLDFNWYGRVLTQTNAAIWENVQIDYTPVPEPGSLMVLAGGLVGLAATIRRRK